MGGGKVGYRTPGNSKGTKNSGEHSRIYPTLSVLNGLVLQQVSKQVKEKKSKRTMK